MNSLQKKLVAVTALILTISACGSSGSNSDSTTPTAEETRSPTTPNSKPLSAKPSR